MKKNYLKALQTEERLKLFYLAIEHGNETEALRMFSYSKNALRVTCYLLESLRVMKRFDLIDAITAETVVYASDAEPFLTAYFGHERAEEIVKQNRLRRQKKDKDDRMNAVRSQNKGKLTPEFLASITEPDEWTVILAKHTIAEIYEIVKESPEHCREIAKNTEMFPLDFLVSQKDAQTLSATLFGNRSTKEGVKLMHKLLEENPHSAAVLYQLSMPLVDKVLAQTHAKLFYDDVKVNGFQRLNRVRRLTDEEWLWWHKCDKEAMIAFAKKTNQKHALRRTGHFWTALFI